MKKGQGPRLRTDGEGAHISRAHVGLVEHVRIGLQPEKVAGVDEFSILEEIVEVTAAARGVNPLLQSACCSVAVVVDGGGCRSLAEC